MALYSNMEELVRIGAYTRGADAEVDEAVRVWPRLEAFLAQDVRLACQPDTAFAELAAALADAQPSPGAPAVSDRIRR
jgi:flagellum-specific ATP synthase